MKLFALALLTLPAYGALAPTAGTACASTSNVASLTCLVGTVASGNLIVINIVAAGAGSATVADNVDGAYTQNGSNAALGDNFVQQWYLVSSGGGSRTVTATATGGVKFLTILPLTLSGQATSSLIDETQTSAGFATSRTCGPFTRTGNEIIIGAALYGGTGLDVGWSNAGSDGTFTMGALISNGNVSEPGASAYQVITSGTTYNWVISVTGSVGIMICSALTIRESAAPPAPGPTTAVAGKATVTGPAVVKE